MINQLFCFKIENERYGDLCERELYADFDVENFDFYSNGKPFSIKERGFKYGKYLISEIDEQFGKDFKIILSNEITNSADIDQQEKTITIGMKKYSEYVISAQRLFTIKFIEKYLKEKPLERDVNLALLNFDEPEDYTVGLAIIKSFFDKLNRYNPQQKNEIVELFLNEGFFDLITSHPASFQKMVNLDEEKKIMLLENIEDTSLWHSRIKKMIKSLDDFKSLIEGIRTARENVGYDSFTDDEKRIHTFLTENYWLLGIEYFGCEFHSQYDKNGKRTDSDVKTGNLKRPDIILKKLSGESDSIYWELEGINDVLQKRGYAGEDVIDGASQLLRYLIDAVQEGEYPKGKVVVGFAEKNTSEESYKKELIKINNYLKNIEVLSYDMLIEISQKTIDFFTTKTNKSLGE